MKLTKLAEFGSTGQLLISKFHQLSGGKSGSGCGNPPPRAEFIAQLGTVEAMTNASVVDTAMNRGNCLAKKRKERRNITTSKSRYRMSEQSAQAVCQHGIDANSRMDDRKSQRQNGSCTIDGKVVGATANFVVAIS